MVLSENTCNFEYCMYNFCVLFYPIVLLWAFKPEHGCKQKFKLNQIKTAKNLEDLQGRRNSACGTSYMTAQRGKVLAVVTLLHKTTLLLHSNHCGQHSLPLPVCRPAVESALPSGRKEVSCHSRFIGSFATLTSPDPLSPFHTR